MVHAMIATQADCKPGRGSGWRTWPSNAGRVASVFGILLLLLAIAPLGRAAEKNPNSSCLECHSDNTLTKTNSAGKEISLFIDEAKLRSSVHSTNTCASCHADLTDKHPDDEVAAKPVNCAACHKSESEDYAGSIHGASHKLGASGAAA